VEDDKRGRFKLPWELKPESAAVLFICTMVQTMTQLWDSL